MSTPSTRRDSWPADRSADEKLDVSYICADLKISRRTFQEWRAKGRAPAFTRIPNGELRITRAEYDAWWESLKKATK